MGNNFNFDTMEFTAPVVATNYDTNKAVGYLRVSSNGQITDGDGINSQLKACKIAEDELNLSMIKTFKDEAISGKVIDRPGLVRSLAFLDEMNKIPGPQNIKYFMCTEISRISRPEFLDEGLMLCRMIREKGVIIYDVFSKDYYERGDDMKILQLMLKLSAAKQERENGANRATNGMKARLIDGYRPFSSPPAGYKNIKIDSGGKRKNAFAVKDEPYATILANAFIKYSTGELYNNKEVADYLTAHNFKTNSQTTSGKKIYSSLFNLLTTPQKLYFYAGYVVYPKRGYTVPIPGKHERLFDDEVLSNIIKRLKHKEEKRPQVTLTNSHEEFPLRSVLRSKECKCSMYGSFARGRREKYPYYECKNTSCGLKEKSISRSCPRKDVHSSIEELLGSFQGNDDLHKIVKDVGKEILEKRNQVHISEVKVLQQTIIKLEQERQRYEEKFIDPDFTDQELQVSFKSNWKTCKEKIAKARVQLQELNTNEDTYEHLPDIINTIKNPLSIWHTADAQTKQLLLKVMFGGVLEYQKNEGLRTPHFGLPMRDRTICDTEFTGIWVHSGSNRGPPA